MDSHKRNQAAFSYNSEANRAALSKSSTQSLSTSNIDHFVVLWGFYVKCRTVGDILKSKQDAMMLIYVYVNNAVN